MRLFEAVVDVIVGLISAFKTREIAFAFAFGILLVGLLVYLVWVLRPHLRFVNAVTSATGEVRDAAANGAWSTEDKVADLDKKLAGNAILSAAWKGYRQGLRRNSKKEGQLVNLVDPYAWFALDRLPGRGYEKWATTMAGVSLTVGLLFTFVGLSAALFRVGEAGADTAQLRLAIADILQISSAKFITSMAGIVAYIGWALAARFHASKQSKVVLIFAAATQSLTALVTPEALLLDQLEESREQTSRLRTLADDMAVSFDASLTKVVGHRIDALPAAVGAALRPALESSVQPVVDAIQGMGTSIGAGNHSALEGMISGLVTGVHDATGREMQALVEAMQGAAEELKTAKSGIGASGVEFSEMLLQAAKGMEASSARMAEAMERRAGEIDARMERIDDTLSKGASNFDTMGTKMSERLDQGLHGAIEGIAAAGRAGAATAREQAQAGLAPVLSELATLIGEIRNSADESRRALVAGGQSAARDLGLAMANVGGTLAGASSQASEVLVQSFENATAKMVAAVENAVGGYRAATDALATRMANVEQSFSVLERSVRQSAGQLDEAGGKMTAAGRTFNTAADHVERATAPVLASLTTVESASISARDTLRLVLETSSAVRDTATAMAASSQSAIDAFRSYEQRFAGVDASLGQTVAKMRDGVIELGNHVTEVVKSYDEHLARAVGQLRVGVDSITDALEGVGDKLAAAA